MDIKGLFPLAAIVIGAAVSVVGWISAGFPPLASRAYVDGLYWQVTCRQYKNQLHIDEIDVFQWEVSNPKPYSRNVQQQIDALTKDAAWLNDQIEKNCQ